MSYFLPNLGRKYTSSRSLECLAGANGLVVGTTNYRWRINTGPWSVSKAFAPYFRVELPESNATYTVELELDDGTNPAVNLTQSVTKVDTADPYVGWDPETQRIANKLPLFHKGRRLRSSNWQKFMNGLGSAQGEMVAEAARVINSSYIRTCPVDEIDEYGEVWADPGKIRAARDENANRIANPTMSLLRTPFGEPQEWALNGAEWAVDETVSLYGNHSLRCNPGVGNRDTAAQILPIQLSTGDKLTASLFYRTPLASSTASPSVDFFLQVVVLYEDGSVGSSSVTLPPGTDSRWGTADVTLTATARVVRAFAVVIVEGIPATSPFNFYIGGVSASVNGRRQDFSYGKVQPFFLEFPTDHAAEPSREIWFTSAPAEFERKIIPTRVGTPTSGSAGVYTAPELSTQFRIHMAQGDVARLAYGPSNNKVGLFEVSEVNDLIKEYDVAFYDQGLEGYVPATGFRVEASTYYRDRLWVVGSFEDQTAADPLQYTASWQGRGAPVSGGNRMRYLLAMNSQLPAEEVDYMEALAAYPILELADGNPIVRVSFTSGDPKWVYLYSTTQEYVQELYYDVAWAQGDGRVATREIYSSLTVN